MCESFCHQNTLTMDEKLILHNTLIISAFWPYCAPYNEFLVNFSNQHACCFWHDIIPFWYYQNYMLSWFCNKIDCYIFVAIICLLSKHTFWFNSWLFMLVFFLVHRRSVFWIIIKSSMSDLFTNVFKDLLICLNMKVLNHEIS